METPSSPQENSPEVPSDFDAEVRHMIDEELLYYLDQSVSNTPLFEDTIRETDIDPYSL